jgi:hypothetical protein
MAWTAPRTWTDGELVTAAIMNPHIRDNQLAMGPHLIVRKSSDESDSTGVLQNDDSLLLALATNEIWQFRLNLLIVSAATTDFKCRFTFPSGSISALGISEAGGTWNGKDISATASPSQTWNVSTSDTVSNHVVIDGVMSNGGSAGNLQLQWSGQAAAACVVKANSTLWAVKLA